MGYNITRRARRYNPGAVSNNKIGKHEKWYNEFSKVKFDIFSGDGEIGIVAPRMDHQFRKKVLLGLGVMAASIAVFGVLLFWLAGKVENDSNKAALARAAITSYGRAVAILAELKSRAAEVEKLNRQLGALLPAREALIEFPKFLEDQGRVNGVSVNFAFKGGPAAEPQADQPGSASFSIDARGEMERLRAFFRELESGSIRFISVLDSLDVNWSGGEHRAVAQGRVFFK